MELYDAIEGRRSIRRYKTDPIPKDVLERLLAAAQWAPSWAHSQCPEVLLISSPERKAQLVESLPPTNPACKAILHAPVVAVFCARRGKAGFIKGQAVTIRGDWMLFDTGLAMQNFMLAAHAEGLGTVCVGLFDTEKAARILQVPEGVEVVAITPLGYPDIEPKIPPRKDRAEFAHWEAYET